GVAVGLGWASNAGHVNMKGGKKGSGKVWGGRETASAISQKKVHGNRLARTVALGHQVEMTVAVEVGDRQHLAVTNQAVKRSRKVITVPGSEPNREAVGEIPHDDQVRNLVFVQIRHDDSPGVGACFARHGLLK